MLISTLPVNPEGDRGWRKEGNDMTVQPYLFFEGRCEEAIEFYKDAVGAEVLMLLRFRDCPQPAPPGMAAPDPEEVMHASLRIGGTYSLSRRQPSSTVSRAMRPSRMWSTRSPLK